MYNVEAALIGILGVWGALFIVWALHAWKKSVKAFEEESRLLDDPELLQMAGLREAMRRRKQG